MTISLYQGKENETGNAETLDDAQSENIKFRQPLIFRGDDKIPFREVNAAKEIAEGENRFTPVLSERTPQAFWKNNIHSYRGQTRYSQPLMPATEPRGISPPIATDPSSLDSRYAGSGYSEESSSGARSGDYRGPPYPDSRDPSDSSSKHSTYTETRDDFGKFLPEDYRTKIEKDAEEMIKSKKNSTNSNRPKAYTPDEAHTPSIQKPKNYIKNRQTAYHNDHRFHRPKNPTNHNYHREKEAGSKTFFFLGKEQPLSYPNHPESFYDFKPTDYHSTPEADSRGKSPMADLPQNQENTRPPATVTQQGHWRPFSAGTKHHLRAYDDRPDCSSKRNPDATSQYHAPHERYPYSHSAGPYEPPLIDGSSYYSTSSEMNQNEQISKQKSPLVTHYSPYASQYGAKSIDNSGEKTDIYQADAGKYDSYQGDAYPPSPIAPVKPYSGYSPETLPYSEHPSPNAPVDKYSDYSSVPVKLNSGYKPPTSPAKPYSDYPPSTSPAKPYSEYPPPSSPARPYSEYPPSISPAKPYSEYPPSTSPARPYSEYPPSTSPAKPYSEYPPSISPAKPYSEYPPSTGPEKTQSEYPPAALDEQLLQYAPLTAPVEPFSGYAPPGVDTPPFSGYSQPPLSQPDYVRQFYPEAYDGSDEEEPQQKFYETYQSVIDLYRSYGFHPLEPGQVAQLYDARFQVGSPFRAKIPVVGMASIERPVTNNKVPRLIEQISSKPDQGTSSYESSPALPGEVNYKGQNGQRSTIVSPFQQQNVPIHSSKNNFDQEYVPYDSNQSPSISAEHKDSSMSKPATFDTQTETPKEFFSQNQNPIRPTPSEGFTRESPLNDVKTFPIKIRDVNPDYYDKPTDDNMDNMKTGPATAPPHTIVRNNPYRIHSNTNESKSGIYRERPRNYGSQALILNLNRQNSIYKSNAIDAPKDEISYSHAFKEAKDFRPVYPITIETMFKKGKDAFANPEKERKSDREDSKKPTSRYATKGTTQDEFQHQYDQETTIGANSKTLSRKNKNKSRHLRPKKHKHLERSESDDQMKVAASEQNDRLKSSDGFFQYANVPGAETYQYGYRMGGQNHTEEKHHQTKGIQSKIKMVWKNKNGDSGDHYWEFNHSSKENSD